MGRFTLFFYEATDAGLEIKPEGIIVAILVSQAIEVASLIVLEKSIVRDI